MNLGSLQHLVRSVCTLVEQRLDAIPKTERSIAAASAAFVRAFPTDSAQ